MGDTVTQYWSSSVLTTQERTGFSTSLFIVAVGLLLVLIITRIDWAVVVATEWQQHDSNDKKAAKELESSNPQRTT